MSLDNETFKAMKATKRQEINSVSMQRPHVVILGAGASLATCPNGDKKGRKLPLMNNLVETIRLQRYLTILPDNLRGDNFEEIYSHLIYYKICVGDLGHLEKDIYNYLYSLELPDEPTIYDHLVLSLRDKDIIATFNWDPLLLQAFLRSKSKSGLSLPKLLFLHGNVGTGVCLKDKEAGVNGHNCSKCNQAFTPTKLLYPIKHKNYNEDPFIKDEWGVLGNYLKNAFMVTVFGYSAPQSDTVAMNLLQKDWGTPEQRNLERFEIIDIKNEDDLCAAWKGFIHTHHYQVVNSFYESWISKHPRRTGEAWLNQSIEGKYIEENPIPRNYNFNELWGWLDTFKTAEGLSQND